MGMNRASLQVFALGFPGLLLFAVVSPAGTFGEANISPPNQIDWIGHPNAYMGQNGTIGITVCADLAFPNSQEMLAPLGRVVATWNAMSPTNNNLNPSSTVPADHFDFESAALHELGHCALALGHTNEPLLGLFTSGFTEATPGANGIENQNNGFDGIQGSSDDQRGDDVNLHWYRIEDNNPFTIGTIVDSSTYSRSLSDLPNTSGHDKFVQNANKSVGMEFFSLPNARATMFTSRSRGEEQRTLGFDDVATVRYGMSGLDEMQGTADDYTIQLDLIGKIATCQVLVRFETPIVKPGDDPPPAQCASSPVKITTNHYRLGSMAVIRFNPDVLWHFGDSPDLTIAISDETPLVPPGATLVYTVEVENVGQIAPSGPAEVTTSVPEHTTFDAMGSAPGWSCSGNTAGSPCVMTVVLPSGQPAQAFAFSVVVDDPFPPDGVEIAISGQVTASGGDAHPDDNFAMETTPVGTIEVFEDGFESGDVCQWSDVIP